MKIARESEGRGIARESEHRGIAPGSEHHSTNGVRIPTDRDCSVTDSRGGGASRTSMHKRLGWFGHGFGFRVQGSRFQVSGFGLRVQGFGFRISNFGWGGQTGEFQGKDVGLGDVEACRV